MIDERLKLFDDMTKSIIPNDFREYLIKCGFFTAPASSKYHLAYEGGLFEHSINVTTSLLELTINLNLKWERPESPIIIGMFHDLCKADQYIYNNETKCYGWNYSQKVLGHGDKSIKLLLEFMELTNEEKACIEYHMGSFTDKSKWTDYTNAIHTYPNVLYTHLADMTATHIIERKINNNECD